KDVPSLLKDLAEPKVQKQLGSLRKKSKDDASVALYLKHRSYSLPFEEKDVTAQRKALTALKDKGNDAKAGDAELKLHAGIKEWPARRLAAPEAVLADLKKVKAAADAVTVGDSDPTLTAVIDAEANAGKADRAKALLAGRLKQFDEKTKGRMPVPVI